MMKILRVTRSVELSSGGPIEGVIQSTKGFTRLGCQTDIFTLLGEESSFEVGNGSIFCPERGKGNYGFSLQACLWMLSHLKNYDVIVIHGLWQFHGFCAMLCCWWLKKDYVLFTHGMLDPWFQKNYPLKHLKKVFYWLLAERWVMSRAKKVLFTSEQEKCLARGSFPFYQCQEQVINYGTTPISGSIDEDLFAQAYPEVRNKRVILFLGRIHPKKGCDLLIEAFADCCCEMPDVLLVMAGPDQVNWKVSLQSKAEKMGVAAKIIWTGMLKGDLKHGAIACAEVLILPSHQENFGIVVAEALSLSRPVLISNKVNIWKEILTAGAGFVEADDLEGTKKLLQKWFDLSAIERDTMAKNAVQCFSDHFDIDRQAEKMLTILSK